MQLLRFMLMHHQLHLNLKSFHLCLQVILQSLFLLLVDIKQLLPPFSVFTLIAVGLCKPGPHFALLAVGLILDDIGLTETFIVITRLPWLYNDWTQCATRQIANIQIWIRTPSHY